MFSNRETAMSNWLVSLIREYKAIPDVKRHDLNWFRTLQFAYRTRGGGPRIFVHPNVYCYFHETAKFEGKGPLFLGKRWPKCRYMPSQIRMFQDSTLSMLGLLNFHTGLSVSVHPGAHLCLGSGRHNTHVTIDCFQEIIIGENGGLGRYSSVRDSDNHYLSGSKAITAPVRIGNHVWVGINVTILKGVTIGDGAVIGAGSVVSRDIPARCLVAGNPPKVVRHDVEWSWNQFPDKKVDDSVSELLADAPIILQQ
jgi:acetyltransferase-like isoleucine patch superfamily enzyme